jgi:histidinol phosphatase-like enzyme
MNPDDVMVDAARIGVLRRYQAEGWRVLGLSWQPEIADGTRAQGDVDAVFARLGGHISEEGGGTPSGVSIEVHYCPHPAGPPRCWCRKPLPGLGVLLIHHHKLDPARCIYVGDGAQDPGFARKLGFEYAAAADFFSINP